MQPFNPQSFIAQVVAYLDSHDPTPELNCLRLVVLSGICPEKLVSLHTSQFDVDNPVITPSVRAFFRRVAPDGAGYYFPVGTSHTTIGAVQKVWKELCLHANIRGPNDSEPTLELLAPTAVRVLVEPARK